MTAINFLLDPTGVFVLTDTLMTTESGEPAAFVSKAYTVPQIGTLISGRGSSDLIAGWAFDVTCRTLVADVDMLIGLAPEGLRSRWATLDGQRTATSTVFVFGWSPAENRFIGYAFRSGDDFEPERLEYGRRCAPGLEDTERWAVLMENPDPIAGLLDVMIAAAEESRACADPAEGCHIGGEVILHSLLRADDGEPHISSRIVHYFPDRDVDYAKAITLL